MDGSDRAMLQLPHAQAIEPRLLTCPVTFCEAAYVHRNVRPFIVVDMMSHPTWERSINFSPV
ncbi:hypothetical protein PtB15_15B398 [Puccinia triticina]|nr:hypothetical protein PtB15_15B398 [Puccinia triticina]